MRVLIDYIAINRSIKELGVLCACASESIDNLIDVVANVDIFWDGDANAEFITKINEDIAYFEAVILKMRQFVKKLDEVISEYQATEKIVNQIIGGLKIGL